MLINKVSETSREAPRDGASEEELNDKCSLVTHFSNGHLNTENGDCFTNFFEYSVFVLETQFCTNTSKGYGTTLDFTAIEWRTN